MKIVFLLFVFVSVFFSTTNASDSHSLNQVNEKIEQRVYTGIDSLLVFRNNQLINEAYFNNFDKNTLHQTRSTFKSISGLLAAIAFDKKILNPDELVIPLISRYINIKTVSEKKSTIKVLDLLNMQSGLDCSEMPGTGPYHDEAVDNGAAPLTYILNMAMNLEPGKEWKYCNANTFLLGVAISAGLKRAGLPSINDFAKTNLFQPLGITNYRTYQTPEGFLYAQGNARFLPQDLAKFGLLVLNKGKWQSRQIISKQHIDAILNGVVSTHWSWTDLLKAHPQLNSKYAYQWYQTQFKVNNEMLSVAHSWGNGGQFIFIVPTLNAVVVFTGSNYGDITKQKQAFEIMQLYILPSLE